MENVNKLVFSMNSLAMMEEYLEDTDMESERLEKAYDDMCSMKGGVENFKPEEAELLFKAIESVNSEEVEHMFAEIIENHIKVVKEILSSVGVNFKESV